MATLVDILCMTPSFHIFFSPGPCGPACRDYSPLAEMSLKPLLWKHYSSYLVRVSVHTSSSRIVKPCIKFCLLYDFSEMIDIHEFPRMCHESYSDGTKVKFCCSFHLFTTGGMKKPMGQCCYQIDLSFFIINWCKRYQLFLCAARNLRTIYKNTYSEDLV